MFFSPTPASLPSRARTIDLLRPIVRDGVILYLAAWQAHLNVTGPSAGELHGLFKSLYGTVFSITDDVAERIRTLGGTVDLLSVLSTRVQTGDKVEPVTDGLALCRLLAPMVRSLARGMDAAFRSVEEDMTADGDVLQGAIRGLEKLGWMLAMHVPDLPAE